MENQGEKMKKQDRSSHGEVSAGDITQTTLRSAGVSKVETNPLTLLFTEKKLANHSSQIENICKRRHVKVFKIASTELLKLDNARDSCKVMPRFGEREASRQTLLIIGQGFCKCNFKGKCATEKLSH